MEGMNGMMGGGFGTFGILLWLALLALAAWVVTRLTRDRRDGETLREQRDPAEEILRQRYARGEIQVEEYQRSLATLRGEPLEGGGTGDYDERGRR